MPLRRLAPAVAALTLALAGASTAAAPRAAASPAPRLANPTASARRLVNSFFLMLVHSDTAGLEKLLSPAFQYQRVDGFGSGKAGFVADPPMPSSYKLSALKATQAGAVLVARYRARVEGLTTPRLSVFSWNGSRWQLIAHANFGP